MDSTERRRLLAALHGLLLEARGPVSLTDLAAAVQMAAPLALKDPRAAARRALAGRLDAIPVDGGRWVLMEHALEGARFRCTPHAEEIKQGRLYVGSRFSPFLPVYISPARSIRLVDASAGLSMYVEMVDTPACFIGLAEWYRRTGFSAGDSIMVSVSYADAPTFTIAHEPISRRDQMTAGWTRQFADAALELLIGWRREEVPVAALVQRVLAGNEEWLDSPPDDYRDLFARDGRFRLLEGGVVSQVDYRRPIDYLHLFPRWGRGSFQALNPGYFTPLESDEPGLERQRGHWLRLLSVEVIALDLPARLTTLRLHTDSSAGAFRSDVELPLRTRARLASSLLATLRHRFKLMVAGQAPAGHGSADAVAVVIEDEPAVVRELTGFLKPLGAAAETPVGAAAVDSLRRGRLEFVGPLAS